MENENVLEIIRKSSFIAIHVFSILASSIVFIFFVTWLFNFSINIPEFLSFFIIGELIAIPFISIIMFILVPRKTSRILCILYFALWIFAVYQTFFCNC